MAINWSQIEGYSEDMSAEDKLALLEKQTGDIPGKPAADPKSTKEYADLKAQFDRTSHDLAEAKKQLRAKKTEAEQATSDKEADHQAMQAELESLRRERDLNNHKASYLALGYSEETATAAATAMVDGDTATLFAAMKEHCEASEKAMRDRMLNETPVPPAGEPKNDVSDGEKLVQCVAKNASDAAKAAQDILAQYMS